MASDSGHQPVLLAETLDLLQVRTGGYYVDCTIGRAGHALAIAERGGQVLGLDADPEAIRAVSALAGGSIIPIQAYFDELETVVKDFAPVDGVLFDLGVSSPQLDDPARGFSFGKEGPLDMRLDPARGQPAATLVNQASADELARIFRQYGEEPHAGRMARAIEAARPLRTTTELAAVIQRAAGGRGRIHPATRIFQALRIATNRELDRLSSALVQAAGILRSGGRLAVITFHSLEDRIVKTFLATESRDCICPPRTPVCVCGHHATLRLVNRKPVVPGEAEVARNPRARSAKLRAAERL